MKYTHDMLCYSYHFSRSQKPFIYSTNDSHFGLGNLRLYAEMQNMDWGILLSQLSKQACG